MFFVAEVETARKITAVNYKAKKVNSSSLDFARHIIM